ncbi:Tyrosine--tRNA ligase, mitochondrial [Hypsizygus marmoreus]|uniref:Tyrosine--tRNA ligase n=1 Tax=Hypsizygus marmoreus TaxID=39966 RepID=A0A369JUD0_HYPMA|nr:Tyrosine--tRNA ligase, mitochondrial [Hypsizygus marmoreus]
MFLLLGRHVARKTRPAHSLACVQRRRYALPTNLLDDLTDRGFVHHVTRPTILREALESKRQVVYVGVDPTAQSLHIGHLIPLMCLLHFQLRGHKVIPLIGGATGRIGDPSGRQLERQPANVKQIEENVANLTQGIQTFFKRAFVYADARIAHKEESSVEPVVANNLNWHEGVNMLEFLRTVGIHARVNTMLNRESVRARLTSQQGLSFTEFAYQLLQAYDFYHLHKQFGCTIQIGGSDQWGNILAGLELIGRLEGSSTTEHASSSELHSEAFGITTPLLTTASGEKFGKSAGNAVWLNSDLTSIFDFYQYFVKVEDADVEKYLKLFTLLSRTDIEAVMQTHLENPEKRIAQRRLAAEVTEMVHTSDGLARAQTLTSLLFESDYVGLSANKIISAFENDPRLVLVDEDELLDLAIMKQAAKHRLVPSTSAARTLVQSRGLYVNNETVPEPQFRIPKEELIDGRLAILRAGKDKLLILATRQ